MSVPPGEGLATVGADVGFLDAALVGAHVVAHAVLPLEALLADGTGERLLVRVGQTVAVEVIDVPEGLATRLTRMVLPHRIRVGIRGPLWRKQKQINWKCFSHKQKSKCILCQLFGYVMYLKMHTNVRALSEPFF